MTPPARHSGHATLAATVAAVILIASCSGSHPVRNQRHAPMHHSASTPQTTGGPGTSTSVATPVLQTPGTLPDGAFPSVLDPARDGSLRPIHVQLTTVAKVDEPTSMVARPGHPGELFLAERAGQIRLVTQDRAGPKLTVHTGVLADLSSRISTQGEEGLLGLAFSHDGNTVYVSYTLRDSNSRIDAARVVSDGAQTRIGPLSKLLEVDQGGSVFHKGGDLAVDANGNLIIGLGDGGPEDDPDQHAQNPRLLLGKILRIDPNHPAGGRPYGIPNGNPYAHDGNGRPEIWLTGVRNPWRFSLDPKSGDIWIGDVGQDRYEEVDRLPAGPISNGANLGWSGYEGTFVFAPGRVNGPSVPPVFEMSHSEGVCAVTGGVVYRGRRIPALNGVYLYSDLCRAGVYGIRATTPANGIGRVLDERLLDGTSGADQIISFATDAEGDVYTLSLNGKIRALTAAR